VNAFRRQGCESALYRGRAVQQPDRDLIDTPTQPQSVGMGDKPGGRIRMTDRSVTDQQQIVADRRGPGVPTLTARAVGPEYWVFDVEIRFTRRA